MSTIAYLVDLVILLMVGAGVLTTALLYIIVEWFR